MEMRKGELGSVCMHAQYFNKSDLDDTISGDPE